MKGASPERCVEGVLLAAGASARMRGRDKLLETVDGETLLRKAARVAVESAVDRVLVVLPPEHRARHAALAGLEVEIVPSPDRQEGMAASLRAGVAALSDKCDAVVIMLADMPGVTPDHLDRLLTAFDPAQGREICRAMAQDGRPGHPVLFGKRFFAALAGLRGDRGASSVIEAARGSVVAVPTEGQGAVMDLDTPEAFAKWRQAGRN